MKSSLLKNSYALGYNTRDNPQDIPTNACQSLINLFPGNPLCRPRAGITPFNNINTTSTPGACAWMIPWKDADLGELLICLYQKTWYVQFEGNPILSSIDMGGYTFSAGQVKGHAVAGIAAYVLVDDSINPLWIIQRKWGTAASFQLRPANIPRPDVTFTALRGTGGNITTGSWVGYAISFVNRNDVGSYDGTIDDPQPIAVTLASGAFNPALCESIDVIAGRVFFNDPTSGGAAVVLTVTLHSGIVDPQATHMRIYRTDEAASQTEAAGLSYRWEADMPIKGSHYTPPGGGVLTTFESNNTSGTIEGSLDLLKEIGFDPAPQGDFIYFYNSRIWIGGDYTGEAVGRWYYSAVPQDVQYPQKWFSMFSLSEQFKDCSLNNSEPPSGIAVSGSDLFLFMKTSLWYLKDGDPEDYEPLLIEGGWGTEFPKSITEIGGQIFYLSHVGPAVISADQAQVFSTHTAGEVWPHTYNGPGYFYTLNDDQKPLVIGWYSNESWFLGYGSTIIGCFMPGDPNVQGMGPFQVVPAAPNQIITQVGILGLNAVIMSVVAAATYFWNFMDESRPPYDGPLTTPYQFMLRAKSKAFYVNGTNPEQSAELYDILFHGIWTDSQNLMLKVIGDFFRFGAFIAYSQFGAAASPLTAAVLQNSWRQMERQGFPEGLVARSFELEWTKFNAPPFDFKHRGFTIRIKKIAGEMPEFEGGANSGGPFVLQFDDAGLSGRAITVFSDAGLPGRDLSQYTFNDAQQRS